MRRLVLSVIVVGLLSAPVMAGEALTKRQIINRSAPICRTIIEVSAPHLERANEAAEQGKINRFIKESRRAIFEVRPYVRDLRELQPPTGARNYRRFVRQGSVALDWLDLALDALEAEREDLANARQAEALDHAARAKRAAKRYGLRRPCIRVVS